jgi:hypothetical protein
MLTQALPPDPIASPEPPVQALAATSPESPIHFK